MPPKTRVSSRLANKKRKADEVDPSEEEDRPKKKQKIEKKGNEDEKSDLKFKKSEKHLNNIIGQLPNEVWKIIINYCFWVDPQHHSNSVSAAPRVIKRVLSLTSRWCRQLIENLTRDIQQLQDPLENGSATAYCSSHGYVSLLKYAIKQGASIDSVTVTEAARFGQVGCLKVLDERGCDPKMRKKGLDSAARYGQLTTLIYYLDSGVKGDTSTVKNAIESGSVSLVKHLQGINAIRSYDGLSYYAARSGSLTMVKYIEQYTPLDQRCIEGSTFGGSVEVLEYLLDKGFGWEEDEEDAFEHLKTIRDDGFNRDKCDYIKYAIQHEAPIGNLLQRLVINDDLLTLQALADRNLNKLPWNRDTVVSAAYEGRLDMLKLLVEICEEDGMRRNNNYYGEDGMRNDSYLAVQIAAQREHFEFFKYMIEQGAQYDANTFYLVTSAPVLQYIKPKFNGNSELLLAVTRACNIEALKILHENEDDFQWPDNVFDTIDLENHMSNTFTNAIEVIEYLRQHGCEWTAGLCANAAKKSVLEVLKYCHENGCPWDERTTALAVRGAFEGNEYCEEAYQCLLYALDNGCPYNAELKLLASGRLEMLKYAHENGALWSTDTIIEAITHVTYVLGHSAFSEDCFDYAIANGCPWDPQQAPILTMLKPLNGSKRRAKTTMSKRTINRKTELKIGALIDYNLISIKSVVKKCR